MWYSIRSTSEDEARSKAGRPLLSQSGHQPWLDARAHIHSTSATSIGMTSSERISTRAPSNEPRRSLIPSFHQDWPAQSRLNIGSLGWCTHTVDEKECVIDLPTTVREPSGFQLADPLLTLTATSTRLQHVFHDYFCDQAALGPLHSPSWSWCLPECGRVLLG